LISYPRDTAEHLGNQNDVALLASADGLRQEARAVIASMLERCPEGCTAYVVEVPAPVNAPLRAALAEQAAMEPAGSLGRYRQTGTGLPLEVLAFRIRPAASGSP
jgi:hypothetical protein